MSTEPEAALDLLREWAMWTPTEPPFILDADRAILGSARSTPCLVTFSSWADAYAADDFGRPGDKRLHLGLLPEPFCGNVLRASIYVLLLNPGKGNTDYYGEYEVPRYREALLATLKQEFKSVPIPFLFLDPQYAWHGGYDWWHGKLATVIEELSRRWRVSYASARARLGSELASIELVPYHSAGFADGDGWIRQIHSVALARAYVASVVVPRVQRGEAIAIVTRQTKVWNLPEHPGVIRYSDQEARAAHLSPNSRGGRALLHHLAP
jgi:hypothetical protein